VQFSVPFDGANSNLTVQSDISWTEFATHLANTMSLSPKNVRVAYRFSTEPRTAPFSHVASGVQLIELMDKAREAMEQLVKNPRSKKKFVVELKDLSAQGKDKASLPHHITLNDFPSLYMILPYPYQAFVDPRTLIFYLHIRFQYWWPPFT
jgi:hypothetical protein